MIQDFTEISANLINVLRSKSNILIVVKGSPDPDVLASSYFLAKLGKAFDCSCVILSETKASLPQNQTMINRLNIPLQTKIPDLSSYDGYAVFDYASPEYEGIHESIPCLIHIDHHGPGNSQIKPHYQLIDESVNSVSTLLSGVFLLNRDLFSKEIAKKISTALCYGILSDTDNLTIGSDTDKEQFEKLHVEADPAILDMFTQMPYSEETLTLISKALIGSIYYKDWLVSGIGFVPARMRDSLAITADFLLEREDVSTVVIFALVENSKELFIDASFRTKLTNLDLNRLIKNITPNGGGRRYKGAFQLDMSYFRSVSDKRQLWETVKDATIENIKRGRDTIRIDEMKSFFVDLRNHITDIFSDTK
ncbi:MAG: DHH family phosphoesterase [Spirochaetota bacterium]